MSDPDERSDEPFEGVAECAPLPAPGAKPGDQVRTAILSALVLTLLTGCVFPLILLAYASCMANNGLAMAGLNSNSVFYNVTTTIAMLAGRYGLAALALTLAGRVAAQPRVPVTSGTLPDDTAAFGALVFAAILVIGALSFFPALVLGPIVEQLQH